MHKREISIYFNIGTTGSTVDDRRMKLTNKMGHLYLEWKPYVYYTETDLKLILRHFYHPKTEKLLTHFFAE